MITCYVFSEQIRGLCEWLKVDGIHIMPEEHRKLAMAVKDKLLAMMGEA